ncbi:hypothetical protein [Desulfovibrio litoralis]|uniref:Uncharacterized protein n=1 Tax=Desulfovibrio litoralis DSM 11393 TaxID=1121455 RepID=A0A1M7SG55_9BACT|nr:hypothetical protein [Desulfovibrio litoralis]SHN57473.1 hypothetical protein SAMN02745728_00910 [Desulfovibrio litoralis DSM 11393]
MPPLLKKDELSEFIQTGKAKIQAEKLLGESTDHIQYGGKTVYIYQYYENCITKSVWFHKLLDLLTLGFFSDVLDTEDKKLRTLYIEYTEQDLIKEFGANPKKYLQ